MIDDSLSWCVIRYVEVVRSKEELQVALYSSRKSS